MYKPVGVRVFPSQRSESIRSSDNLIHYRVPPSEPPIDYTMRVKPKVRSDYRLVFVPDRKLDTSDYLEESEEDVVVREEWQPVDAPSQHITEVLEKVKPAGVPRLPHRIRRDTVDETEAVLGELDTVLDEDEQMSFEQIRQRVKDMNLNFRPYSSNYEDYEISEEPSHYPDGFHSTEEVVTRMKKIAISPPGTITVPVMSETVIEDLKRVPDGVHDVHSVNEDRKEKIQRMYNKAHEECRLARLRYTPDFFLDQTPQFERNSRTQKPLWKRKLLAAKYATEALRQHEERVWTDFDQWKRQIEPSYRQSPHSSYKSYGSTGSARLY